MTKHIRALIILSLAILIIFIWWLSPKHFLNNISANEIEYILINYGTLGDELIITDKNHISYITSNIQNIEFKKNKISIAYAGTGIRLAFYTSKNELIDEFCINQKHTIRQDPFFYSSTKSSPPLCYDYLYELEPQLTNNKP